MLLTLALSWSLVSAPYEFLITGNERTKEYLDAQQTLPELSKLQQFHYVFVPGFLSNIKTKILSELPHTPTHRPGEYFDDEMEVVREFGAKADMVKDLQS